MRNKDISIEIYNAVPISFAIKSEEKFEGDFKSEKFNLDLTSKFSIDRDNSAVAIEIDLDVILKTNEKSLFSIKSFFEFGVVNLEEVLIGKEGNYVLESGFARKLLNISIGGTRGMLSVYLDPTPYKEFTLPIANIPDEFFKK